MKYLLSRHQLNAAHAAKTRTDLAEPRPFVSVLTSSAQIVHDAASASADHVDGGTAAASAIPADSPTSANCASALA